MRFLFSILALFLAINASGQIKIDRTDFVSSIHSLNYRDTLAATLIPYMRNTPGIIIAVKDSIFIRNVAASKWIFISKGSIVNTGINSNTCDLFITGHGVKIGGVLQTRCTTIPFP